MNVITIGRHPKNDVAINDSKVSRHHLQIIQDDTGNFRVADFGSTNGTFVNGEKIQGEVPLYPNDMIRIGQTVLPWRSYFTHNDAATPAVVPKRKTWLRTAGIAGASVVAVALFFLVVWSLYTGTFGASHTVKMRQENGVSYVPVKINDVELQFIFDTGASSICISVVEAVMLYRQGTLSDGDILGNEQFQDATGTISQGMSINLKSVKIGGKELNNIRATVVGNEVAPLLLGQSVLSQFGSYTIDNNKNEIVFN
jgi:clan AA aspartic protease (TIGR02281 family)